MLMYLPFGNNLKVNVIVGDIILEIGSLATRLSFEERLCEYLKKIPRYEKRIQDMVCQRQWRINLP